MKKLKVVTVVGTRPEIIRLSRLIPLLDEHTDHILVHTGQNYDPLLSDVFFKDLQLRQPDYYLGVDTNSFGAVMGDTLRKSEEVFLKERPDAVMILGDTNSAIAAVAAERLHIPVYHMEAGNRSFDNNVPEELNRKLIDHVATFNLPYTEHARRNLLSEGLHPKYIHKTGSPIGEIYKYFSSKISQSTVIDDLKLRAREYFLVSLHRQENVDSPKRLSESLESLIQVRDEWKLPLIVSTHPRTRIQLDSMSHSSLNGFNFHEPFGYFDYNKLQLGSLCTISDSGTISEESSIIGFPAVTLRDSMERPEAVERGSITLAGPGSESLLECIRLAISRGSSLSEPPDGYGETNFSESVLGFLFSTVHQVRHLKGLRY